MSVPLVSVVIPIYNVEKYIGACLESMIAQTYPNLELWVVDDASTDNTMKEVAQFQDSRIRILRNKTNLGLAASVNRAILQAEGKYIARMDGDDISMPTRIEKQVQFLEHHPDVSIVGTAMQSFGYSNYAHYFPTTHASCKAQLLFNVCFGHPTVLIRKAVFDDPSNLYWEELQQYSEEYELWCRLVDSHQFANLSEALVMYRTFPPSSRSEAAARRKVNSFTIRKNFVASQWGNQSEGDYHCHDQVCNLSQGNKLQLEEWIGWLKKMDQINLVRRAFEADSLGKELSKRCFELRYANRHLGIWNAWNWYTKKDSLRDYSLSWQQHTKFILRSLLKA
jgi:glycosyltransferase involved in cell wall biosynthesis